MGTKDKVIFGQNLCLRAKNQELEGYLKTLENEDPMVAGLLEIWIAIYKSQAPVAIDRARDLLPMVLKDTEAQVVLYRALGMAYRMVGDTDTSDNYLIKLHGASVKAGDRENEFQARLLAFYNKFFRAEYDSLYTELQRFVREPDIIDNQKPLYLLAGIEIIRGEPETALEIMETLAEIEENDVSRYGTVELKGLANRMLGDFGKAIDLYLESARGLADFGSAYSAFPCAKALEICRLAGREKPPPDLMERCIELSRNGSWGETAAGQEVLALLKEDDGEVARGLLESATNYHRAHQPVEAFTSGLSSALLAWKSGSPVFMDAMRFTAPLIPLHRGFRKDPLLGEFLARVQPLSGYTERDKGTGIRANLVGIFRLSVDGKEIPFSPWSKSNPARALVYLLLSPTHRVARDHLFYLLWPRSRYTEEKSAILEGVISELRERLGRPGLLTSGPDYYQLEETRTDLSELDELVRLAEATEDLIEKEDLLRRSKEMAQGELLPDITDDPNVDEYRTYYERLRKKTLGRHSELSFN